MGPSRLAIAVLTFLLDAGYVDPGYAGEESGGGYARALELFEKGRLAEAAAICEAGMRQDAGNFRLTYLFGQILFTQAQQLEKKQRSNPEAPAMFQRAKGMLLAAEAASPRPLDSGLDHAIGSILLREQRPDDAIERFSRAIAKAPGNGTFLRLRGHTYLQVGDYEAAQRDLQASLDLEPGTTRAGSGSQRRSTSEAGSKRPGRSCGDISAVSRALLRTPGTPMFSSRFSSTPWPPTRSRRRATLSRWRSLSGRRIPCCSSWG